MDLSTFQPLFDWLHSHPTWAGFFVFLVALSESLIVIGLVVPGVVLMFGVGTLIGTGVMGLWESLVWAFFGAVAGDGISFGIGYYFKDTVSRWWPFSRKPELLEQGQGFFEKHGGKSILLGRFVGPIRPIIPGVAGMLQMSPVRFFVYNVVSALGWAPVALIPGMVFGASIGLASEVATRLAVMLVVIALLLWLLVIVVHRLVLFITPHTDEWIEKALGWAFRHPTIGIYTSSILRPDYPPSSGLLFWGGLLVLSSWLFTYFAFVATTDSPLLQLDLAFFQLAQGLRNPLIDSFAIVLYELADIEVMGAFAALVAVGLWQRKYKVAFRYWIMLFASFVVVLMVLQFSLDLSRPDVIEGPIFESAFPNGHVFMSAVLLGFFMVLVTDSIKTALRWIVYTLAAALVFLIGFAAVYLGAAWFSDVMGAYGIGLFWAVLFGLAYRRHRREPIAKSSLLVVAFLPMFVIVPWHVTDRFAKDQDKFAVQVFTREMTVSDWWREAWQEQPAFRSDYAGHVSDPVRIQWSGTATDISEFITSSGWQVPPDLDLKTGLYLFAAEPAIEQSALLPHLHKGQYEQLHFVRVDDQTGLRYVIRFWNSNTIMQPENKPLWLATYTVQDLQDYIGLFKFPRTTGIADFEPLKVFSNLNVLRYKVVNSKALAASHPGQSQLLLVDTINEKPEFQ